MDLDAVMDQLGSALERIPDLHGRVHPYWADRITPPAAIVELPEEITYDQTAGRGADRMDVQALVCVARLDARTSRSALAPYAAGSGARSVKATVESHPATAWDSIRVQRCEFGMVSVGDVNYLAARFYFDVFGEGA